MIVKLDSELFGCHDLRADLSYLIQTIARYGHSLHADKATISDTSWMSQTDSDILDEASIASAVDDSKKPDCEVIRDASGIHMAKIFSVPEAIKYTSQPLEIILENGTNDSPLIQAVIRSYTSAQAKSRNAYYDHRLTFGTGGGCGNIKTYIQGKLAQYQNRPKFLRYYVILDGDRRYPAHTVSKHNKLIAYLCSISVKHHIFEKRCMENYLPAGCFPNKDANTSWINAFNALSATQRDFLNISGGFRGDVPDCDKHKILPDDSNIRGLLPAGQQAFYADVPNANFAILSKGYPLKSFKNNFPKGYDDGKVNTATLNAVQLHQNDPNELACIARDIEQLL